MFINLCYSQSPWVLPRKAPVLVSHPRIKMWDLWRLSPQHPLDPQIKPFFIISLSSRVIGLGMTRGLNTMKGILGGRCWEMNTS